MEEGNSQHRAGALNREKTQRRVRAPPFEKHEKSWREGGLTLGAEDDCYVQVHWLSLFFSGIAGRLRPVLYTQVTGPHAVRVCQRNVAGPETGGSPDEQPGSSRVPTPALNRLEERRFLSCTKLAGLTDPAGATGVLVVPGSVYLEKYSRLRCCFTCYSRPLWGSLLSKPSTALTIKFSPANPVRTLARPLVMSTQPPPTNAAAACGSLQTPIKSDTRKTMRIPVFRRLWKRAFSLGVLCLPVNILVLRHHGTATLSWSATTSNLCKIMAVAGVS